MKPKIYCRTNRDETSGADHKLMYMIVFRRKDTVQSFWERGTRPVHVWRASPQYSASWCDPDGTWLNGSASQSQRLVSSCVHLELHTTHVCVCLSVSVLGVRQQTLKWLEFVDKDVLCIMTIWSRATPTCIVLVSTFSISRFLLFCIVTPGYESYPCSGLSQGCNTSEGSLRPPRGICAEWNPHRPLSNASSVHW